MGESSRPSSTPPHGQEGDPIRRMMEETRRDAIEAYTGPTPTAPPQGQLRAFVEAMKRELGDDKELIRQALSDLHALERQNLRNHFEARQEFVRQVADADRLATESIREYGLQTLKWLFLLNAGGIAVLVAYVGAAGKVPTQLSAFAPMLKALWPFSLGCVLVVLAGMTGFFNFSYASASMPSAESLHQFLNPQSRAWPPAKQQSPTESPFDFYNRYSWRIAASRKLAIGLGLGSAACFAYGVYRVLRVALG